MAATGKEELDSSEEKLGTEGIDRSRSGGIGGLEDSSILKRDCKVVVEEESCSIAGESHMELCPKTIVDMRRMHSWLVLQSCPLLCSQIVEKQNPKLTIV